MATTMKAPAPAVLKALLMKAHAAGMAAGNGSTPPVMVVERHANMADDSSPVAERWFVPEGPAGFAWVTVRPANSRLAKVMETTFDGKFGGSAKHDSYGGGMMLWVWEFGQSMVRKEAYATAFAKTLRDAGFDKVRAGSRMD
jgi:hypothetical protein